MTKEANQEKRIITGGPDILGLLMALFDGKLTHFSIRRMTPIETGEKKFEPPEIGCMHGYTTPFPDSFNLKITGLDTDDRKRWDIRGVIEGYEAIGSRKDRQYSDERFSATYDSSTRSGYFISFGPSADAEEKTGT